MRIQGKRANFLKRFLTSKFNTDYSFGAVYAKSITELAAQYTLSSYDASYLELAIRKGTAIGTLDGNLSKACAKAGIKTI
jgi:predicted nucleic acid-binding protein